jgi:outer membrane receptor protein involved in Fe transport
LNLLSGPFAVAQEKKLKEAAQEEKAREEYKLEPMTVTAQKQEENVQEVPVSITVFDSLDIEDKKIESVREIADFVPNLMIFDCGQSALSQPTMRGFGYTDIEFDDFEDVLGDYEDNDNPFAPEYTFNIGAQYRHYSGFYARADLIGYGKMYFDKANDYSRDAYEIVNAKIGYEAKHFDIYLYGKNLFDEEYDSDEYYGGMYTIYSDPGEIGLQLVYRF